MNQLENTKNYSSYLSNTFNVYYTTVKEGRCASPGSTTLYLLSYANWKNSEVYFDQSMEAVEILLNTIKQDQIILYWEGVSGLLRALNLLINENILHGSITKTLLPLEEELIRNIAFFHGKDIIADEIPFVGSLLLEIYNRRRLKNIARTEISLSLVQLINSLDNSSLNVINNQRALNLFLHKCSSDNFCPALIERIRNQEFSSVSNVQKIDPLSINKDNLTSLITVDECFNEQETINLNDLILLEQVSRIPSGYHHYYLFN